MVDADVPSGGYGLNTWTRALRRDRIRITLPHETAPNLLELRGFDDRITCVERRPAAEPLRANGGSHGRVQAVVRRQTGGRSL